MGVPFRSFLRGAFHSTLRDFGQKQNRLLHAPKAPGTSNFVYPSCSELMPAIRSGTGESHFPSTAWAALPANKQKEKKMKTPKYEIEIKEPKTVGKTRAYVTVKLGPVWISCRLDESKGKFFLNPPANFV